MIATEDANSSHVATATVILKLLDMNDNNPLFDKKSYVFFINETSANGTVVGHINVCEILFKITKRKRGKWKHFFIEEFEYIGLSGEILVLHEWLPFQKSSCT